MIKFEELKTYFSNSKKLPKNLVIFVNFLFYIGGFFLFYYYLNTTGGAVLYLTVIFHVAWYDGLKRGIIFAGIGIVSNIILFLVINERNLLLIVSFQGIVFYFLFAVSVGYLRDTNEKLKKAYQKIKQLNRLLPICSHCKKIRDDSGYWHQVEIYIRNNSDTEFSHSLCPECIETYYSDLD